MKSNKTLYVKNRNEWRKWLENNHLSEDEIWLIYFKKHTGQPTIPYNDAVEEALCFGWIDSTVKKIDSEKYKQRYTPRKKNSVWSKINKERAIKMINSGLMVKEGLNKIEEAKKNGKWEEAYSSKKELDIPCDMKEALMEDKKAWANFNNFANSYKNMYIGWVTAAKREETRKKRINEVVNRSIQNIKPGMM
ncbi:MAG: YdeI/OmpD-associated family protein [Bacteroidales bacterium]|nr:YdeI/OmpD-associated family protein [Bacteroidales bacterium]